jgi:hypothetical protein
MRLRPNLPSAVPSESFASFLAPFRDIPALQDRLLAVLDALPEEVQVDFREDTRFRIALDDFVPSEGRNVWLACPAPGGNGSRCVVLKPRLGDCAKDFALYVIAHELAHAYLRNGVWGDHADPETSADALAATWGFIKPSI